MQLLKIESIERLWAFRLFTEETASESTKSEVEFLSTLPVGRGERRLALTVVLLSVAIFLAAAPFAKIPLMPIWAFIPIYQSALVINDLMTAALLFGQSSILRSTALRVLATGYLFTAFMAVAHALTFPHLFAATGLLGAGTQTTAWLYMFWHGGFPLFVIAYVIIKDSNPKIVSMQRRTYAVVLYSIAGALIATLGFTYLATTGQGILPAIMEGHHYTDAMKVVISSVWMLSLLALIVLLRQEKRSVLDLWLMVAMCAWLFDIALAAVLNGGRFDLGFYVGRIYGLLAASFVLLVLLFEHGMLYARLVRAHKSEQQKTAELMSANHELEAFSYSVSHDLRTPLRAVNGYAKMLEADYRESLDEEGNRLLGVVLDRSRQMGELIDDLLAFSRLGRQPLKTYPVQLESLVRLILDELSPDYEGRVIDFTIGKLGIVESDPMLMKQVLLNLLGNAIKFTRNVNHAVIEVGCRDDATDNEKIYYVKDNGAGFYMRYIDKLFGVFQRLHSNEEFDGTGIGLAIVQRIINRHGGRVWADAIVGSGATIYFSFPQKNGRA